MHPKGLEPALAEGIRQGTALRSSVGPIIPELAESDKAPLDKVIMRRRLMNGIQFCSGRG